MGESNRNQQSIWWERILNIAKYVDKLGKAEAFKWLSREKEITKYAEIKPEDSEKVYSKTEGIVASDTEIFIDD